MALAIKIANARLILMAFFEYNAIYKDGRRYLYSEFPAEFIWVPKTREWKRC
jgi:hypothetical protein